jgi:putative ABC transport system substrate-binding protein
MKRREFIAGLGSAAAWPLVARAEQPSVPVIGFLGLSSAKANAPYTAWFGRGLNEAGFTEGQNVIIQYRWADGHYDRLPSLATQMVRDHVAIIFASGGPPQQWPP